MKKFVQYGAGNIGRGFIGQLFNEAGYEVVFVDVVDAVIEKFNADHAYPIRIVTRDGAHEKMMTGVRAVDGKDLEQTAAEIATADVMATAVGVNILPRIVPNLIAGFRRRWTEGNMSPLNVIICENLLDANLYLEKLIKKELTSEECEVFDRTIGLVEASIGRMVPVMTPEMAEGNLLRVWVEEFGQLPIDKAAYKGELPAIKALVPFTPFEFYIRRKLFVHNMGHAVTAYLGKLQGAHLIADAVEIPTVKLLAERAMIESATALSKDFGTSLPELLDHVDDLLYRFGNRLLGDTTERVGRDPVRKLASNDRLVGAALLCEEYGVSTTYIALGIAAGLNFRVESDPASLKVAELVEREGVTAALAKVCALPENTRTYGKVLQFYEILKRDPRDLTSVLNLAEKLDDAFRKSKD